MLFLFIWDSIHPSSTPVLSLCHSQRFYNINLKKKVIEETSPLNLSKLTGIHKLFQVLLSMWAHGRAGSSLNRTIPPNISQWLWECRILWLDCSIWDDIIMWTWWNVPGLVLSGSSLRFPPQSAVRSCDNPISYSVWFSPLPALHIRPTIQVQWLSTILE